MVDLTWTFDLGSYQTPQLLELSGIGNPDILAQYGIGVSINLPGVGENLREPCLQYFLVDPITSRCLSVEDHLGLTITAEVDIDEPTLDDLANPDFVKAQEEL